MTSNEATFEPSEDLPVILYVGHHESQRTVEVTCETLNQAQASGYDLITAPLTTEHFQSRVLAELKKYVDKLQGSVNPDFVPLSLISPLMPEDTDRKPDDINSSIFAIVSPWIDLGSPDPLIANVSRQVFNLEVAYAAFCGISNLIIHGPQAGSNVTQYSRAVAEGLGVGLFLNLHILLPPCGELLEAEALETHLSQLAREEYIFKIEDEDENDSETFDTWEAWNNIRTLCNYSSRLSVAFEMPRELQSLDIRSQWYSEPVRVIFIPRTSFLRNGKGYPVLHKDNQQLLSRMMTLRYPPLVILANVDPIPSVNGYDGGQFNEPTPAEASALSKDKPIDPLAHLRYLRHLQQTQPPRSPIERFGQQYQDYVQSPLQPLTDNLESVTYEVFEKDPVKYDWYERAIASALKDLRKKLGSERKPVVAIAGAGRGPLVAKALSASRTTGIDVHCCAVEKNPNAHVIIQRKNMTDPLWNKQVMIYKSDMRTWPGPTIDGKVQKVDILISELLGSFADNELSPECLDGVQHVLHPDHGINIPQSYSAHLTPIASPRLYADLLSRNGEDRWELPYVVLLHQFDFLCTTSKKSLDSVAVDIQEAWKFSHPVPDAIIQQSLLRAGGTADGGGWTGGDGYFETVLYSGSEGPIELSTNPVTMEAKSKDMISWFPIFFPLKVPLYIPDNSLIEVSMWRQTDDRKVWYEWIVEVHCKGPGGRKFKVGSSELHTSRKNGCLM